MFAWFAVPAHPQTSTKRIVIYSSCLSIAFLAAVLFSFHGRLQASKSILTARGISGVPAQSQPRLIASYGKLPLSFEVNQGQTAPQVKFLSRGRGYTLFLTGDEAVLALAKPSAFSSQLLANRIPGSQGWNSMEGGGKLLALPGGAQRMTDRRPRTTPLIQNPKSKIENEFVRLRLVGANLNAAVSGCDELPGKANYFLGNDPKKWRANVLTYAKVRYHNVYPGVDLVYYGNQSGQLEYDFIVAPGADPTAIALDVGAGLVPAGPAAHSLRATGRGRPQGSPLQIDRAGDLVIAGGGGDVRFNKPNVFQPDTGPSLATRHSSPVQGHFRLDARNRVRFALGPYDHSRPLVIDPALTFSTYLSGSGATLPGSAGSAVAVDSAGNIYITGGTSQTDFPTVNPLQASLAGSENVFVAKLTPTGPALVYSTFLGGSSVDVGNGIAVDSEDNIYLVGSTESADFPVVNALESSPKSPGYHAFVAKLNAAGSSLVYSTYLGGSSAEFGYGIAADSSGNATVTGNTSSTDFPLLNPIQSNPTGAFLSKLNAAGTALVYSTYLGGAAGTSASAVALDPSGNAYVTGSSGANFPVTPGAFQTSCTKTGPSSACAYVTEVNSAGTVMLYATYLSGSGQDVGTGIAVDSSDNAYVTGYTSSGNFPTDNPVQASLQGSQDAFVSKLNSTGSQLLYSTFLGGSEQANYTPLTQGNAIALDPSGDAYVTGFTNTTDFPLVSPIQTADNAQSPNENETAFVAELNPSGSALVYSTYLGGNIYDVGNGIAVDSSGDAWVIGSTSSTDFPVVNPIQATSSITLAFQTAVFVAELSPGPVPAVSLSAPALSFPGTYLNVTASQQSVTLTNLGNATLNISGMVATGDFALVTTATSCPYQGGTLAALANCTIDVTFTPLATGNLTGNVAITDNAGGSPQAVQLSGTGYPTVAATVSPTSLSFGNQLVSTTSTPQGVMITNPGMAAITISSLTISSGWTETDNCLPAIAANSSCNIRVVFAPTVSGSQTGSITITDIANNSPQVVQLSGTGVAGPASLSPTSLTFGSQAVYSTSASQTIMIISPNNGGPGVPGVAISGDFQQTNVCQSLTVLTLDSPCPITISFTPTAIGTRTGTLTVTYINPTPATLTASLTGTGTAPEAGVSVTALTFTGQAVGSASSPQAVTLSNTGSLPLTISSVTATGDFSQTNTCGNSVAANGSCTISVTFTPTAPGTRTGTLTISDNSNNTPLGTTQTVSLSGTGVGPAVSLSPTGLNFGAQTVSAQSAPQTITLTNTGNGALTPLTITASGDFAQTNTCAGSVAASASCPISVTFKPTAGGARSGALTLTDNASNSPQTIQLSGTGMDFQMSSSVTSQSVSPGQVANYSLTLAPEDGFSQTVNLTCSGAPSESTCTLTPNSLALNGTASATVAVAVATTAASLAPPWERVLPPGITGLRRMVWLYALLALAGVAALAGAGKRRAACLLGACLLMAMLWCACGGGGGQVTQTLGTPPGTYTVDVTAADATTSTLTHTMKLTLTVD